MKKENPKETPGRSKVQLQLIPPAASREMAEALNTGAAKYGPWNWRDDPIRICTYIGAMKRHLDALMEGEDIDPESGAHHLGHVMAGAGIVLDALAHDCLLDDRPGAADAG